MINRRRRYKSGFYGSVEGEYKGEKDLVLAIIVGRRVSYDNLYNIIPPTITKVKELNLYFDLRSQVGNFFSPQFQNFSEILARGKETVFCTEILNTLAHYRSFFWKEYEIVTNLILFYSLQAPTWQKELYDAYMSEYLSRHHPDTVEGSELERLLESNLNLMKEVVIKLPNTYLVNTGNSDPAALPYYVTKNNILENEHYNIIFTNQPYMLSYCSYPKFAVCTMKGDKSAFITKANLFQHMTENNKTLIKFLQENEVTIDPSLYTHILAICGDKKLSLEGWTRYGVVSTLNKFIKEHERGAIDLSIKYSMRSMSEFLAYKSSSAWKLTEEMIANYEKNYRILQYSEEPSEYLPASVVSINDQMAQQRIDLDAIYEANHKYFQRYPIAIKNFMCGEH